MEWIRKSIEQKTDEESAPSLAPSPVGIQRGALPPESFRAATNPDLLHTGLAIVRPEPPFRRPVFVLPQIRRPVFGELAIQDFPHGRGPWPRVTFGRYRLREVWPVELARCQNQTAPRPAPHLDRLPVASPVVAEHGPTDLPVSFPKVSGIVSGFDLHHQEQVPL